MSDNLRAPFPYFGGKSRAVGLVWPRLGNVVNYVEPFAGSLAMLLGCPDEQRPRVETVNDASGFVANFWRAVAWPEPEEGERRREMVADAVARWADWPVLEVDLHARHRWLLSQAAALRARLEDPFDFDPMLAGWWVWGASAWIGSGWCEEGRTAATQIPNLIGNGGTPARGDGKPGYGKGIHAAGMRAPSQRLPDLSGGTQWGTDEPNARAGRGVHSTTVREPSRQLLHAATAGMGIHACGARVRLYDIFAALSTRLRYTRVACGDWSRICTPAVTYRHGLTAVFLDPPYDGYEHVYGAAKDGEPISAKVRAWALENGQRPDMRIALAGYAGEHDALEAAGWDVVAWRAKGGYSNQRDGGDNGNKHRERIWFSPHCVRHEQHVKKCDDMPLFSSIRAAE